MTSEHAQGHEERRAYRVEGMSCEHCRAAVRDEVGRLAGVASVDVDLAGGRMLVRGQALDDGAVRAAVAEAGYEATPA